MKYFSLVLIVFIFVGCSFKSSHESFIDSMDIYISYKDYQKYKTKFYRISDKYLINTKYDNHGNTIYYYIWGKGRDCPCKYHIIVNKHGIMIGWTFDKCEKEKCCVNLG